MKKLVVYLLVVAFLFTACGKAEANDSQALHTEEVNRDTETQESTESVIGSEVTEEEVQTEKPSEQPAPPAVEMESWASGYYVYDPHNTRGLSNEISPHVYGIAFNGYFKKNPHLMTRFIAEGHIYECKYFHFPGGYYSDNSLELVASLGHRSVFWSVAYADWSTTDLKGAEYSFRFYH